jgi:hypothetical protein
VHSTGPMVLTLNQKIARYEKALHEDALFIKKRLLIYEQKNWLPYYSACGSWCIIL